MRFDVFWMERKRIGEKDSRIISSFPCSWSWHYCNGDLISNGKHPNSIIFGGNSFISIDLQFVSYKRDYLFDQWLVYSSIINVVIENLTIGIRLGHLSYYKPGFYFFPKWIFCFWNCYMMFFLKLMFWIFFSGEGKKTIILPERAYQLTKYHRVGFMGCFLANDLMLPQFKRAFLGMFYSLVLFDYYYFFKLYSFVSFAICP